jgi:hypothetical protein
MHFQHVPQVPNVFHKMFPIAAGWIWLQGANGKLIESLAAHGQGAVYKWI